MINFREVNFINKKNETMKPNIGITDKNLKEICRLLNNCLADTHILYIKLRKYHWNLKGDNFMELHKVFEDQYNLVQEAIDEIAIRGGQIVGYAMETKSEY